VRAGSRAAWHLPRTLEKRELITPLSNGLSTSPRAALALEELHGALMLLCRLTRVEGAKVAAFSRFGILLA
jgi:hypothetical protein